MLKIFLKLLNSGYYNAWALGYLQNLTGDQNLTEENADINSVINPVKDFIECRLIENHKDGSPDINYKQINGCIKELAEFIHNAKFEENNKLMDRNEVNLLAQTFKKYLNQLNGNK